MQQVMGFTTQNYLDGACGKFALQHALLLLGIPVSQKDITKATGVSPIITRAVGTGPNRIIRGLEYFGCRAVEHTADSPAAFRRQLDEMLAKGCPCIISVEGGSHWAVIAGKSSGRYWWIDSADEEVFGCWNWRKIVDWIANEEAYLIGVKPKSSRQLLHSLVPHFQKVTARLQDEDLREYWGYYLSDLIESFDCPADGSEAITAGEFFSRYGKQMTDAVCHQYLYADEDQVSWELENYRAVAEAHSLTVSKSKVTWGIANLTAALTCISILEE